MADLKLYRDILCIAVDSQGNTNNVLTSPTEISAFTSGDTGFIEALSPIEEVTGRFYVNMDVSLYAFDTIYQLIWTVRYTPEAPLRNLITRFKLNPNIHLGTSVYVEVISSPIPLQV